MREKNLLVIVPRLVAAAVGHLKILFQNVSVAHGQALSLILFFILLSKRILFLVTYILPCILFPLSCKQCFNFISEPCLNLLRTCSSFTFVFTLCFIRFWLERAFLKVPLRSNSRYPFFYIFVHNKSFRKILPNFKLLRTSELAFFGPLFPRIYGRH